MLFIFIIVIFSPVEFITFYGKINANLHESSSGMEQRNKGGDRSHPRARCTRRKGFWGQTQGLSVMFNPEITSLPQLIPGELRLNPVDKYVCFF